MQTNESGFGGLGGFGGFGGFTHDDLVAGSATSQQLETTSKAAKRRSGGGGTDYADYAVDGSDTHDAALAKKQRVHFIKEVGEGTVAKRQFDRTYRESPYWQRLLTGNLEDGLVSKRAPSAPCYLGEFPTGQLRTGVAHGSNCPAYGGMHAWMAEELDGVGVCPIPVLLGVGPPTDDGQPPNGGRATDPGCKRYRFWWHSHRVNVTEAELSDQHLFPYTTRAEVWALLLAHFRSHNPDFEPARDIPLAWRLTPGLWDSDHHQLSLQSTATSKNADEWLLNRLNAAIEQASLLGEALDSKTAYDIRHYGLIPSGRTLEEVQQLREGRLLTNTPPHILSRMMNMTPMATARDPVGDNTTPRKARSIIMHGWNRWQILVMLRSFDPIPDEPIVVLDLFAGMGTGFLAAVDTPKIVAAPRVLWISVEIDRDSAWLHYNSVFAEATQDAFEGHLEWLSYCDIENGGFRKELTVNVDSYDEDPPEMLDYKKSVQRMVRRLGTGAWWLKAAKIRDLLQSTGVPKRNVLVLNGSPCDDCSGNNPKRQGRHGARSQLFKYGPIVYNLVKTAKINYK